MRIAAIAAAIALVPAAAAAQSQQQFDLVCEGTRRLDLEEPARPATIVYRVDLERNEFCQNECDAVRPLFEVTSGRITLAQPESRRPLFREAYINRSTGELRITTIDSSPPGTFIEVRATCERRAFTPFPQARF